MPTVMADRLDIVISLIAGVVVTLYGFGLIGKRREGSPPAGQERFIKAARWLGPVLVVISVIRLFLE